MKTGIIVDSSLGLTQKEAKECGFYFLPIILYLNNKEYKSGIDVDINWLNDNLELETEFKTSAVPPALIEEAYKEALKENDHVIYVPISKHLSSTMENAKLIAKQKEFEGKVTVFDSEYLTPYFLLMKDRLSKAVKNNEGRDKILEILNYGLKETMYGYLFPKDLKRLYKSGRLSKIQYLAGSALKVVPIIEIVNGSLVNGQVIKTRSHSKAIELVVENVIKRAEELKNKKYDIKIITISNGKDNEFISELEDQLNKKGYKDLLRSHLAPCIVGHVGFGGVGAGVWMDFDKIK